jgi:hypothetical protein
MRELRLAASPKRKKKIEYWQHVGCPSTDSLRVSLGSWFDASWILSPVLLVVVVRSESGITGGAAYCGVRLVQINLYRRCVMKCEII